MHLPAVYFVDDDEDHAPESLQNGNSNLPCMIFLNLNLPKMNGLERLQQQLIEHAALSFIPASMFSTSSHDRGIQQCYSNGASLFIAKPSGVCALVKDHPR